MNKDLELEDLPYKFKSDPAFLINYIYNIRQQLVVDALMQTGKVKATLEDLVACQKAIDNKLVDILATTLAEHGCPRRRKKK